MMRAIGVNAVRIYHAPPKWFLDLAAEHGIRRDGHTLVGAECRFSQHEQTSAGNLRQRFTTT